PRHRMRLARLAPPPARALALAAAAGVGLAYQVQRPTEIPAGGPLSMASFEGFYPGEGSYRWSRGRGRIVFRDPGPGVRALPEGPVLWLRRPPLEAPLVAALTLLLFSGALLRMGTSRPRVWRLGVGLATVVTLGYAFARPYAAWSSGPLLAAAVILAFAAHLAPGAVWSVAQVGAAAFRAWMRGARSALGWAALAVVLAGTVAVIVAQRARPVLDVDVGSGREAALARNLGAFDSAGGATFRQAMRGAAIDLRDFGSGTWSVAVTAALGGESHPLVLARAGGAEVEASLGEAWTTTPLQVRAPW